MQSQQATVYKQCELWWCDPDPQLTDTVGREIQKDRPWLIVSTERLHRGDCVVGLPMSRHVGKALAHLIQVPASEITMVDGTMSIDRVALTDQIRSLSKLRLRKQAGYITRPALLAVMVGLDRYLGRVYPNPKAH